MAKSRICSYMDDQIKVTYNIQTTPIFAHPACGSFPKLCVCAMLKRQQRLRIPILDAHLLASMLLSLPPPICGARLSVERKKRSKVKILPLGSSGTSWLDCFRQYDVRWNPEGNWNQITTLYVLARAACPFYGGTIMWGREVYFAGDYGTPVGIRNRQGNQSAWG